MEMTPGESQKLQRVIDNARAFVKLADEFFPEYPEGFSENLTLLSDAVDDFWTEVLKRPVPPVAEQIAADRLDAPL